MNYHETAKEIVMQFLSAYSSRNINACMDIIAKDRPIMLFGTNSDEVFKTQGQVRDCLLRDFKNMTNIMWGTVTNIAIEADANIASVLVELPISYVTNDKKEDMLFRYAFTLVSHNGRWQITYGMASAPAIAGRYTFSSWG